MYSQYSEQLISITIQILKRHNPQTIQTLKSVLTYMPSPSYSQQILSTAIAQLSKTCPETICWLLQNPECLQPELNATNMITHYLSNKLSNWGFICDRDFYFTPDGQLIANQLIRESLLSNSPNAASIVDDTATLSIIRTLLITEPTG